MSRLRSYLDFTPETAPDTAVFAGEIRIIFWLYRIVLNRIL